MKVLYFCAVPLGIAVRLMVFGADHKTNRSQEGFECMGQVEELRTYR